MNLMEIIRSRITPARAERIHQDIDGSMMEIIPNCVHFLQEDEPKKITNIIVNFISN